MNDPVTKEEVFRAFKMAAIRRGFIKGRRPSGGRRSKYAHYNSTMNARRGPDYQAYLKFREEFRYKGKKVSNGQQFQFKIFHYRNRQVEKRLHKEREVKRTEKELQEVKTELTELKAKYNKK